MAKEKTYSEKLKDPRWQKKRLEVLQRDNFTCQLCGDAETELHVHHHSYIKGRQPWEYESSNFITYCKLCHIFVEYIDTKHKYEVIKGNKRVTGSDGIIMLLVLLNNNGKPCVAVASFDSEDILEVHTLLGPNTINEIVELKNLFHNYEK